jgi:hypothetical protein
MRRGRARTRSLTEAYNRRDLDAMLDEWAPDGVLDWSNARSFDAGVYRGRARSGRFIERFLAAWDEVRTDFVDDPVEVAEDLLIAENVAYM